MCFILYILISMRSYMHFYIIICDTGIHGGIRFDLPDDLFSRQPALAYLPKSLTAPIEGKRVCIV